MGEFKFFYNDKPIAPIVEIGKLPNENLSNGELPFWEKFHNPYLIGKNCSKYFSTHYFRYMNWVERQKFFRRRGLNNKKEKSRR